MYAVSYHMTQRRFRTFDWSRPSNMSWYGKGFYSSSCQDEVKGYYNENSNDKNGYVRFVQDTTGLPYDKARVKALGRGKYEYLLKCVLTMKNPLHFVADKYLQYDMGGREVTRILRYMSDRYIFDHEEFSEQVLDRLREGEKAIKIDRLIRDMHIEYDYNDGTCTSFAAGDFVSDFARCMGHDGIIQQPSEYFHWMYGSMTTVRHYIAFQSTRIKIVKTTQLPRGAY